MKNFKSILYCCVAFILVQSSVFAQQVTQQEAEYAARNAMKRFIETPKDNKLMLVKRINLFVDKNGHTLMYEVIFDNNKGVLLSGNKNCIPVLAYIDAFDVSLFDIKNRACGVEVLMSDYQTQIQASFNATKNNNINKEQWNKMLSPPGSASDWAETPAAIVVQPLITSKWGQDVSNDYIQYVNNVISVSGDCEAYNHHVTESNNCSNFYCDKITKSKKSYTGCVATGMAQIMYYWKYAKNKAFDWCNMVDALNTSSSNYISERNAVANLIERCGNAVNMNYGCAGSSSTLRKAKDALQDYGYSNADLKIRTFLTHASFKENLWQNLDNKHPVLYGGFAGIENVHTMVCDGYGWGDERGEHLFHFNFGWTGANDNWFTISNLCSNNDEGEADRYYFQNAVFDIYPDDYDAMSCKFGYTTSLYNYYANAYAAINAGIYLLSIDIFKQNVSKRSKNLIVDVPKTDDMIMEYFRQIGSNENIKYVATNSVILKPDFHALRGSKFAAYIEPCDNCTGSQSLPASSILPSETVNYQQDDDENTEPIKNSEVRIFPNPNQGVFTISANTEIEGIKVLDLTGHIVYQDNSIQNRQMQIDMGNVTQGVYIVQVKCKDKIYFDKLVIQ